MKPKSDREEWQEWEDVRRQSSACADLTGGWLSRLMRWVERCAEDAQKEIADRRRAAVVHPLSRDTLIQAQEGRE